MNFKKNVLFLIAGAMIAQYSFAARMTVYNETGQDTQVTVYKVGNVVVKTISIKAAEQGKESKESFNTDGWSGFEKIGWSVPGPFGAKIYEASIPSSGNMLTGSVTLLPNGQCAINFDEKGASSSKVHSITVNAYE